MKGVEFDEMIERLKDATQKDKLTWTIEPSDETIFYTSVNGCRIDVSVYYDASVMANKSSIELFNTSGYSFKKKVFSESGKPERYAQIHELYNVINDRYYKVKESEGLILTGLRDLTEEQ